MQNNESEPNTIINKEPEPITFLKEESINELIINKEIQKNDYHYFFLKEMSQ